MSDEVLPQHHLTVPGGDLMTPLEIGGVVLGQEWLYVSGMVQHLVTLLPETSEVDEAPADEALGHAVLRLLNQTVADDRDRYFLKELAVLKDAMAGESAQNQVVQIGRLVSLFGLSKTEYLELLKEFDVYQATAYPAKAPKLRKQDLMNPGGPIEAKYSDFCRLVLTEAEGVMTISMKAPHTGNTHDVAFPVREADLRVGAQDIEGWVMTDLASGNASHIDHEMQLHDEVTDYLKKELARLTDLYRMDQDTFIKGRMPGARHSLLLDPLFDFLLKHHLPQKLDDYDMGLVSEAMYAIENGQYLTVVRVLTLEADLINPTGYCRTGKLASPAVQVLAYQVATELYRAGLRNKNGQATPTELINRLKDGKVKMRVWEQLWKKLSNKYDSDVPPDVRDYLDDQINSHMAMVVELVLKRALGWARGEVVVPSSATPRDVSDLLS